MAGIFSRSIFNNAIFNTAETRRYPGPAGKSKKKKGKERWWQVGDRLYYGRKEQIERIWDDVLAEKPVAPTRIQSKPAPKVEPVYEDVVLPAIEYKAFDWAPYYAMLMRQRDNEAAVAMIEAIKRRIAEDEEDIEMLLLA